MLALTVDFVMISSCLCTTPLYSVFINNRTTRKLSFFFFFCLLHTSGDNDLQCSKLTLSAHLFRQVKSVLRGLRCTGIPFRTHSCLMPSVSRIGSRAT